MTANAGTVAEQLRALGARRILITAAEEGRLRDLRCTMEVCYQPEEVGGTAHFEPTFAIDWMPTADHIRLRSEGGS